MLAVYRRAQNFYFLNLYYLCALKYDCFNMNMTTDKFLKRLTLSCIALTLAHFAVAQESVFQLRYDVYIRAVFERNLAYAAEKLNVDIAEAEEKAAHVFADPSLGVEYGYNDDYNKQMGQSLSLELSRTFTVGKRKANIRLAESEKALTEALLDDYFQRLRAEATLAYIEALRQSELCAIVENSYDNMRKLAESDSLRLALGEITQVDAEQSRLEAGIAYNDLLQAKSDLHNACADLALWMGKTAADTLFFPEGRLHFGARVFDLAHLQTAALANRADLAAAMKNIDVAARALKVAKSDRNTDFDIALGYNYNSTVRNEIAPAPQFNGLTLGVSIPLKFSNFNRGTVHAAEKRTQQAELNYRQTELEVCNSVVQSLNRYNALQRQLLNFDGGILQTAQSVRDGRLFGYKRGKTSLLEAINAQRTYNDTHTAYVETMYRNAAALVELERNAGIWDIRIEK
jgi:cobalt-zinc-cadmium efflux system outer membrane protein